MVEEMWLTHHWGKEGGESQMGVTQGQNCSLLEAWSQFIISYVTLQFIILLFFEDGKEKSTKVFFMLFLVLKEIKKKPEITLRRGPPPWFLSWVYAQMFDKIFLIVERLQIGSSFEMKL